MATPKLRFKEFEESWSQVILDDLAEVERGKFSVRPRNDPRYFGGKMPFVQTGDVTGSDVYLKGFSQTLNEHGIKVSKVFPENTILITIAANIGDTTITQYPVACPDSVVAIQPKKELTNTIFLKNIIDLQKDFLDSQATQNAQKNINLQVLKPLELIVPKLEEQTKIASFLSAVDEKIAQLNQKHELLSQYKQGIMQKIFNQQIRFKADDGSEFGEWVEIKITDVADYVDYRGKTPKKVEDGILLVTAKNIRFGYIDYSISQEYICSDDFDEVMRRGRAEIGDVLITTEAPLGNVASVDRENIALAQRVIKYRGKKGILNNEFLKQKFLSEEFQSLISSKATGGTVQGIKGSTLHNLEIHIPEDIEEQTKIANFLSSIDQKIEVVAQQIEQAKQWKKGLLQQMFV